MNRGEVPEIRGRQVRLPRTSNKPTARFDRLDMELDGCPIWRIQMYLKWYARSGCARAEERLRL
jgi:hypothetical protein